MSLEVYKNTTWQEPTSVKRYENGAWVDCEFVRRYENGQWIDVWNNKPYMEYGWVYTTGDVTPTYTYNVTGEHSFDLGITHQSNTASRSEIIVRYPFFANVGDEITVEMSASNGESTVHETYCTLCISLQNASGIVTKENINFKAFSGSNEYVNTYEITNDLTEVSHIVLVLQVYGIKGDNGSVTINYVTINGEKIKVR